MKRIVSFSCLLLLLVYISPAFADSIGVVSPQPTFSSPRKVVFQLSKEDETDVRRVFNYIHNLQNAYGDSKIVFSVVMQAGAISYLAKTSPFKREIESQLLSGVDFIACENSMQSKNLTHADMITGVSFTQAGMQEIIERQLAGWNYLIP